MASSTNLEERFNAAVKTIQNLPPDGIFQPSNFTKLIFYGLYKQATLGSCKDPRPSVFNYVNRAKWEAWDRCRSMTKEQAMLAYIDEIRKIIETMPQTQEVLEFAQLFGLNNKSVDDESKENDSAALTEKLQDQTIVIKNKENTIKSSINDNDESDPNKHPPVNTHDPIQTFVAAEDDVILPSSLSSSASSLSSSDIDEFYDDPSDLLSLNHEELTSNNNIQQPSIHKTSVHHSSPVFDNQNGTNVPIRHSNVSSKHSSLFRHRNPSNVGQYSTSSGNNNGRHPTNNYNKETQRAILTALTKLQRDINNILERLNRLETSAYLLQQRELSMSSELNSSSQWLPLYGFRRGAITFILLWPFIAFFLIRLYLRAKIIIRFRR